VNFLSAFIKSQVQKVFSDAERIKEDLLYLIHLGTRDNLFEMIFFLPSIYFEIRYV
tara:strand:+ start:494 stop:661 length:168 start_codon:yes stop_codon:yes gene_type:complete